MTMKLMNNQQEKLDGEHGETNDAGLIGTPRRTLPPGSIVVL